MEVQDQVSPSISVQVPSAEQRPTLRLVAGGQFLLGNPAPGLAIFPIQGGKEQIR
jgi:hypothetical protein